MPFDAAPLDIMIPHGPGEDFVALRHCGQQKCAPGHSFGPSVRDHYLIHFAAAGKGFFEKSGQRHALRAGQGFLIVPGEVTTYRADIQDPWEYYWFGFAGDAAPAMLRMCGLSAQNPIFTCADTDAAAKRLKALLHCVRRPHPGRERELLGHTLQFLAQITPLGTQAALLPATPAAQAMQYLRENFSYAITVEDIARHVGLSRSQLFRVFKAQYGHSVRDALLNVRLETARHMLRSGTYTVMQVCYSCGFTDPAYFSAAFRRQCGVSPRAYAQQYKTAFPAGKNGV